MNGKIVGYELHKPSGILPGIELFHSTDGEEWFNVLMDPSRWIGHNHKDEFPGLYDKSGVEIYEGDILLYEDNSGEPGSKLQVQFGEGTFDGGYYRFIGWHCGEDHSAQDVLLSQYGTIEVIGNICENPELL